MEKPKEVSEFVKAVGELPRCWWQRDAEITEGGCHVTFIVNGNPYKRGVPYRSMTWRLAVALVLNDAKYGHTQLDQWELLSEDGEVIQTDTGIHESGKFYVSLRAGVGA